MPAGNYTAKITHPNNDFIKNFNFSVFKSSHYIKDIKIFHGVYNGYVSVTVTLPDDANGFITVNNLFNDTIDYGVAIIHVPFFEIGTFPISIIYNGDRNYEGFEKIDDVEITTSIEVENSTKTYNSVYDFQARLSARDASFLVNQHVIVSVDGVERTVCSNDEGIITLSRLPIGTHKVIVYNPSTDEVSTFTVKILSRFSSNKNIVIDCDTNARYKVKVYDDWGESASGEVVVFKINGKTQSVRVDKNSYASIVIKLAPGTYTITALFKGQSISNKVIVKQTLKAYKKLIIVKKSHKKLILKAILKGSSDKKIIFKFNGKSYCGKTNSKGISKVTITKNIIKKLKIGKKYQVDIC